MKSNPQQGSTHVFNKDIPLITTSSKHVIPITEAQQTINNLDRVTKKPVTLAVLRENDNQKIALTQNRQQFPIQSGKVTPTTE